MLSVHWATNRVNPWLASMPEALSSACYSTERAGQSQVHKQVIIHGLFPFPITLFKASTLAYHVLSGQLVSEEKESRGFGQKQETTSLQRINAIAIQPAHGPEKSLPTLNNTEAMLTEKNKELRNVGGFLFVCWVVCFFFNLLLQKPQSINSTVYWAFKIHI